MNLTRFELWLCGIWLKKKWHLQHLFQGHKLWLRLDTANADVDFLNWLVLVSFLSCEIIPFPVFLCVICVSWLFVLRRSKVAEIFLEHYSYWDYNIRFLVPPASQIKVLRIPASVIMCEAIPYSKSISPLIPIGYNCLGITLINRWTFGSSSQWEN